MTVYSITDEMEALKRRRQLERVPAGAWLQLLRASSGQLPAAPSARPRVRTPMHVALEGFTWRSPDGLIEIAKGERVHPEHELLRDRATASYFVPETSYAARELAGATRSAPAATSRPPKPRDKPWRLPKPSPRTEPCRLPGPPPREDVDLQVSSAPRITVSLRDSVRQTLHGYARATAEDGLETAGFLFGARAWGWHERVPVGWVTSMVKDRRERSCRFDIESLVAEKASLRRSGLKAVELGSWHTHPNTTDGEPSDTDLQNWIQSRDFLDHSFYIGAILTAARHDPQWLRPNVHAWVMRRDNFGRAVCEPALVELGG